MLLNYAEESYPDLFQSIREVMLVISRYINYQENLAFPIVPELWIYKCEISISCMSTGQIICMKIFDLGDTILSKACLIMQKMKISHLHPSFCK